MVKHYREDPSSVLYNHIESGVRKWVPGTSAVVRLEGDPCKFVGQLEVQVNERPSLKL